MSVVQLAHTAPLYRIEIVNTTRFTGVHRTSLLIKMGNAEGVMEPLDLVLPALVINISGKY